MSRRGFSILAVLFAALSFPPHLAADYLYPGSSALQPLATAEPAAPDSLFRSWTGDVDLVRTWSFGAASDFLRNRQNTDDWDVIVSVTGLKRIGAGVVAGLNVPFLVRDKEFAESGLLDVRSFLRARLLGGGPGTGLAGELNVLWPTGDQDPLFPLSLDSPVAGVRLALSGGAGPWRAGANLGYQRYLATETGDDADILYGAWLAGDPDPSYRWVLEYSGSRHDHSGPPGDDQVRDDYALVGLLYEVSEATNLGLAAGRGLGDSAADVRVVVRATTTWGRDGQPRPAPAEAARPAPPPARDGVVVVLARDAGSRSERRRVREALSRGGYTVTEGGPDTLPAGAGNVLYFAPGFQEQAIRLSRLLVFRGPLEALDLKENRDVPPGKLVIVLGAGR